MDYKDKYDEALERARNLYKDAIDMGAKDVIKICEIIFPELAESEDERIREDIISFLRSKNGYMNPNEDWDFHNRWLPWLEKQGQKPFDYESATIVQKDFAPKTAQKGE